MDGFNATALAREDVERVVKPAIRLLIELLIRAEARPAIADHLLEALRETEQGYFDGEALN